MDTLAKLKKLQNMVITLDHSLILARSRGSATRRGEATLRELVTTRERTTRWETEAVEKVEPLVAMKVSFSFARPAGLMLPYALSGKKAL
jgi:hypothetical protein